MRAALHLLARHRQDPVQVVGEQQLLHLLAALRIHPLADHQRPWLLVQGGGFQPAGERRHAPRRLAWRAGAANRFHHLLQMLRGGAAAAADDGEPEVAHEARQVFRQLVGLQRIDGDAFAVLRNAGVGLTGERQGGKVGQRAQRVHHLLRAGRAVEPHDVRAHRGQERGGGERLRAQQHAPRRVEGDLRDHRNAAADVGHRLARAEDLRAQLEEVLRRLGDDAVDAALEQPDGLLAEDLYQLGRSHAAQVGVGARGQKAARSQRAGDETRPPVGALGAVGLRAGEARGGLVDLVHARAQIVLVELGPARAERVGLHRVAARLEVTAVHALDDVGPGQRKDFVAPLAAVEVLDRQLARELHPLQGGAHGAVENDDSPGDRIENVLVCHEGRGP